MGRLMPLKEDLYYLYFPGEGGIHAMHPKTTGETP